MMPSDHVRFLPRFTGALGDSPLRVVSVLVLGLLLASAVAAQITNGGFEDGDLTGWTVTGLGGAEVLQAGNLTPPIAAPEGSFFVLVSTGPNDRPGTADADIDDNGIMDHDITTLRQNFTIASPGQTLSFRWGFLTREADQPAQYDDVLQFTTDTEPLIERSVYKPGGLSPFPDTQPYDGTRYDVSSAGTADNSRFDSGFTGWQDFCIAFPEAGVYTLEFLVADASDSLYDSALVIDDVQAPSTCQGIVQVTNTTGSSLEAKSGALVWTPHQSRSVVTSNNGSVQAFVSSGDYGTGNPNAQSQVFAFNGASYERLTAMVDGEVSRPSLSANGRYVAFAAADNPFAGQATNNDDLNSEIFHLDRVTGVTTQITATSGCANTDPSIGAGGGAAIAFASDCTDIPGVSNTDGNKELVVWDGSVFQSISDTAACTSRSPEISADGLSVAFVSDCNHDSNSDGNFEVFQWNLVTATVVNVTNSSAAGGDLSDSVSTSGDGGVLAFVSTADLDGTHPIGNADGSLEIFTWERAGATFSQLTEGDFFSLNLTARIDDSGAFLGCERLNALTNQSEIFWIERATGLETPVTPFGDSKLPDIGIDTGSPVLYFESRGDLTGNNGDGNIEVFRSLNVFRPTEPVCSNPDLPVPNNSTRSDTLTFTAAGTVADLDPLVEITHRRVRDLVVELEHEASGTRITLFDNITTPTGGRCNRDNIFAVLDDEGDRPIQQECPNQDPTVESPPTFIPLEALGAFDGESVAGDWTLWVTDVRGGASGRLVRWCLYFETN
ncbi:MAG: proprotein convertase P-domain-containing protein [Thermoanaerobaculales bacterium]